MGHRPLDRRRAPRVRRAARAPRALSDHARRLRAQALSGPPLERPEAVCERLLAVQAQDPRGFRLAIRARTRGLTVADVDRALEDRSLVVSWLNRGTLHLVRSEDLAWLHALTTPQLATGNARRLAQEGVEPRAAQRGVTALERALAEHGPLTRGALREHVRAVGVPVAGQALPHLLLAATLRGLIARGPVRDGEQAFVLLRDWLGEPPRVDRDRALAELGRRYLAGHGPADDRDLARWAGITLRDARAALRAADATPGGGPAAHPGPPPRLLGAFDPLLLGWADRTPVVGEHTGLVTDNGLFRPFLLVGGRAAGLWAWRRGAVERTPFTALPADVERALDREAEDVARFLAG